MRLCPEQVTNAEVRDWRGVHLLHFGGSSCSQKVRILLREKGIPWVSHPVDLARQQNTTPGFLGINPRGVVPVLVHDGEVHVESNDIMAYIDEELPSAVERFFPQGDAEHRLVRDSLELEDSLHTELRNITMGFLAPAALAKKSPKTLEAYEKGAARDPKRDREVQWWRDFAERGIPDGLARESAEAFAKAFSTLESRLGAHPWLIGDRISVLEIAWFISMHRLVLAGYPLEQHEHLESHYRRLLRRPAFQEEVEPHGLSGALLTLYGFWRQARGTTLRELLA